MPDETGTEATRSDAPSADESLFGDAADDAVAAVVEGEDSKAETEQDRQGSDDAGHEAGTLENLKREGWSSLPLPLGRSPVPVLVLAQPREGPGRVRPLALARAVHCQHPHLVEPILAQPRDGVAPRRSPQNGLTPVTARGAEVLAQSQPLHPVLGDGGSAVRGVPGQRQAGVGVAHDAHRPGCIRRLRRSVGVRRHVVKPFSPTELAARIRAALRKRAASEPSEPYVLGDLTIDYAERRVTLAGRPLPLIAMEYRLLAELSANAGRLLTCEHLLERVWGEKSSGDVRPMRTIVSKLRRKLGDDADNPTYIFTEPRVGYRMPKGETQNQEEA